MPADPTITAALRAASEAARIAGCQPGCCGEGTGCEVGPCHCAHVSSAAAIAAFLRALPAKHGLRQRAVYFMVEDEWGGAGIAPVAGAEDFASLAAAVEEAARDV